MKMVLVMLFLLYVLYPEPKEVMQSDRRYQPIADVDTRGIRDYPSFLYIYEYDSEKQVSEVCGVGLDQFTGRGCTRGYRLKDGNILFIVYVLSNDYIALKHELNHIIFGPCHTNSGETSEGCEQWLLKNNLDPIGTQEITTTKEENNA